MNLKKMEFENLWSRLQEECTLRELEQIEMQAKPKSDRSLLVARKSLSGQSSESDTQMASTVQRPTHEGSDAGNSKIYDLSFNDSIDLGFEAGQKLEHAAESTVSFNSSGESSFFVPGITGTARCLEGCQAFEGGMDSYGSLKGSSNSTRKIDLGSSPQFLSNSRPDRRSIHRSISSYAPHRKLMGRGSSSGDEMSSSSRMSRSSRSMCDSKFLQTNTSERSLFNSSVSSDSNVAQHRRQETRKKLEEMHLLKKELAEEEDKFSLLIKQQTELRRKQKEAVRELKKMAGK
jgi:hypothetical protein